MTRFEQMATFVAQSSGRAGRTVRVIQTQPSWITRVALLAFLIVIGLPIAILIMAAFLLAVIVFGVLAGVNVLVAKIRSVFPHSNGRENVRIVRRNNRFD